MTPCKCVLRAIFKACHDRFRSIVESERDGSPIKTAPLTWSRVREEYCADFLLLAKRTLTPAEHKLFTYHFLLGADWKLCTRRLGVDKGTFFHAVYRIQAKLGRVYAETEPYALYPLDEYFSPTVRTVSRPSAPPPARVMPLRPPMATKPVDAVAQYELPEAA
ncbi:hypothetical protein [uncultured Paludibaculum sp.]|uniref:hypothetical protein n=1 Tax=uncultured Paludibaculum sp. TaxID=1765020 RepID=UPI002AABB7FA|nr:hypothetical protein [uncultured Paludibaculum sp.]